MDNDIVYRGQVRGQSHHSPMLAPCISYALVLVAGGQPPNVDSRLEIELIIALITNDRPVLFSLCNGSLVLSWRITVQGADCVPRLMFTRCLKLIYTRLIGEGSRSQPVLA